MAWATDEPDGLEAVAYTRDYSASSVWDDVRSGNTDNFSDKPEFINYYSSTDWKVYKVTIKIEPVDS